MKGKSNMNKITKVAVALIAALAMNSGYAALTITGATASSYNFALSNDSILTNGAIFQIGYYNSAVTSASFSGLSSASAFETGWTSLASSTANAFDVPGLRSATADLATGINTYEGKSLVMLVGNSSTISGSTQVGVFSNSSWIVPVNPTGITPTDYAFDVSDVGTQALLKNEIVNGNLVCVVRRLGQPGNTTAVRIPSLSQLLVPHMSLSDIYFPFAELVKDSSHFLDLLYASVFFAYRNARSAFELGGGGSNFNTPGVQMDYSSVLTGNNPTHPIIPITQLLNSTYDPTAIGMAATQAANYTNWSADPLRPTAVNSLGNDYSQPPSANARLFDVYIQAQLKMERFPPLPLFRQRIGDLRYRQLESLFTRGSNWTRARFEEYLTNLDNVYCIYAGNQLCADQSYIILIIMTGSIVSE